MYERLNEVFGDAPRNPWEVEERKRIADLYTYVFKDPRSIDSFIRFIFFYREEIARRKLLISEFGTPSP